MRSGLDRAFANLASAFLAEHPEIRHEWREVRSHIWGDRVDLICGVGSPSEIYASLLDWQIAVGVSNGDHDDFEGFGRGVSEAAVAAEAFEQFVTLLRRHGHLVGGA
jgi:hypothetical protein